jgi:hypothetical protein
MWIGYFFSVIKGVSRALKQVWHPLRPVKLTKFLKPVLLKYRLYCNEKHISVFKKLGIGDPLLKKW